MAQRRAHLLAVVAASAVALTVAGTQSGARAGGGGGHGPRPPDRPTKVVVIVVDALSKEIVEKYDMRNVQALMKDGVDTPKGYLGHTRLGHGRHPQRGHDGRAPQAHGLDRRGLPRRRRRALSSGTATTRATSDHQQLRPRPDVAAPAAAGYPQLADYLDDTGQGVHRQPEGVRRLGVRRSGVGEHLDDHVRQQDVPRARRACRRVVAPRADGMEPAGVPPGVCGSRLRARPGHGVRHDGVPGEPLPARRQPLHGRQGPGTPGW